MIRKTLNFRQIQFLKMIQELGKDENSNFVVPCPITIKATLDDGTYGTMRAATLNALTITYKQWKKENKI